eukprot:TRINITY_DN38060_c0_g1_i1.p1 TRINITY_DN38060_c0_g1~~TRINITY_DN38060_c0_g1_i1.p1  ORF type:complete len:101 (+),score=17.64 TRINITY_DN38060_c0_g1_i1:276-578(+)
MAASISEVTEVKLMLSHHALTAALAYHSLRYHFLQYYGVFYVGIAELSSLPLVAMNLLRMSAQQAQSQALAKLNKALRMNLACIFLVIRGTRWPLVNCGS